MQMLSAFFVRSLVGLAALYSMVASLAGAMDKGLAKGCTIKEVPITRGAVSGPYVQWDEFNIMPLPDQDNLVARTSDSSFVVGKDSAHVLSRIFVGEDSDEKTAVFTETIPWDNSDDRLVPQIILPAKGARVPSRFLNLGCKKTTYVLPRPSLDSVEAHWSNPKQLIAVFMPNDLVIGGSANGTFEVRRADGVVSGSSPASVLHREPVTCDLTQEKIHEEYSISPVGSTRQLETPQGRYIEQMVIFDAEIGWEQTNLIPALVKWLNAPELSLVQFPWQFGASAVKADQHIKLEILSNFVLSASFPKLQGTLRIAPMDSSTALIYDGAEGAKSAYRFTFVRPDEEDPSDVSVRAGRRKDIALGSPFLYKAVLGVALVSVGVSMMIYQGCRNRQHGIKTRTFMKSMIVPGASVLAGAALIARERWGW